MALVDMGVRAVSSRLPKVISPRNHAIIDYVMAGAFFAMVPVLWNRKRRAAIAALACGAVETTTSMLTDYPGGVAKAISFRTHGRMDAGLSGVIASLPNLLAFNEDRSALFFRSQGLGLGAVTSMTDFGPEPREERSRFRRRGYAA